MDRSVPESKLKKRRLRKLWKGSAAAAILILSVVLFFRFASFAIDAGALRIHVVDEGPVVLTVSAAGKTTPAKEYLVTSPVSSPIIKINTQPGKMVKKGESLLGLDINSLRNQNMKLADEISMSLMEIEKKSRQLSAAVSDLSMNLELLRMELRKAETVLSNEIMLDSLGASTADKVMQARLDLDRIKLEISNGQQKLLTTQESNDAEIDIDRLRIEILRRELEMNENLLEQATIQSPADGTVLFVENREGLMVGEGQHVATVADLSGFVIDASVPYGYAERLSQGSQATIKIDRFETGGTVSNLSPTVEGGYVSFTVVPDSLPDNIRIGMRADVYVHHDVRGSTVRIPIFKGYRTDGVYTLWVIGADGIAHPREVLIDGSGIEYLVVRQGLAPGEKVIISDMEKHSKRNRIKLKNL